MECTACPSPSRIKKMGKDRKGNQRFRCLTCRKSFSERPERPLGAMQLPLDKALLCLHLLCEGNAVRSIERIVDVDKKTILKLLVQVGEGCERMLSETIQAVPVQDVQADELWTFIGAKQGIQ